MKCYHMTSIENLKSINEYGLTPRNEANSKLVQDDKVKVFFSEGYEGAIALYVDFDIVYNKVKTGQTTLEDEELSNKIMTSKSLEDYLGDGVYLSFEKNNIYNERNFENGCTSDVIKPQLLKVVLLKNNKNNQYNYSRFEVIKYMMSKISRDEIKYYGVQYPGSPKFEEATTRIQGKVNNFYNNNMNIIKKYKNENFEIVEIKLSDFIKNFMK